MVFFVNRPRPAVRRRHDAEIRGGYQTLGWSAAARTLYGRTSLRNRSKLCKCSAEQTFIVVQRHRCSFELIGFSQDLGPLARELSSCRCRQIDRSVQLQCRPLRTGMDVEGKDFRGQIQRRASVWDVNDAADASLDGSRAQNRVALFPRVAKFFQILDCVQTCATIRDVGIKVGPPAVLDPPRFPRISNASCNRAGSDSARKLDS